MSVVFTDPNDVSAEIKARIEAIPSSAGHLTDVGASVYEGRVHVDDDLVPCTSIIEGTDRVDSQPGRAALWKIAQKYVLVGYDKCDPANPNVKAREIIKDLKRAIFSTNGKPDARLGGKVLEVNYLGRNIGPRADGAAIVMAYIEIEVVYAEHLWLPAE